MTNEELLAAIGARFDRIDSRFEQVDRRFEQLSDSVAQAHNDVHVLHEAQIRSIEKVVEGVNNANERLVRYQGELANELHEMQAFNRVAYQHLDRRINRLLRTP